MLLRRETEVLLECVHLEVPGRVFGWVDGKLVRAGAVRGVVLVQRAWGVGEEVPGRIRGTGRDPGVLCEEERVVIQLVYPVSDTPRRRQRYRPRLIGTSSVGGEHFSPD